MRELEEEFAEAKARGEVTPELKTSLRDARREFRLLREGRRAGPGEARPQPAAAKAKVKGN